MSSSTSNNNNSDTSCFVSLSLSELKQLKVNDKFDLCLKQKRVKIKEYLVNRYVEAKIIELNDEEIKVEYIGSNLELKHEIINITESCSINRLFALNTFSVEYILLKSFPMRACMHPIYYDNNYIVFYSKYSGWIYKYDISNDTLNIIVSYSSPITDVDNNVHNLQCDQRYSSNLNMAFALKKNDILCILDESLFVELNLKTLQWNVIENGGYNVYGGNDNTSYHLGVYIGNKLHLIAHHMHGVFDENKKQFIGIDKYQKYLFAPYWLIYVKSMKLLFAFSDETSNIIFCEMGDIHNNNWYEWKIYDKIPANDTYIPVISGCFLAFHHIIFLLFEESEILCLDIMYHKFFQCTKQYPYSLSNVVFDSKNKFVHLYDSRYNGYHIKINIYDIIPNKLKQFYKIKNTLLILRYSKQCKLAHNLPTDVVAIISRYFDLFSY